MNLAKILMEPTKDDEESPRLCEDYVAKANTMFADLEARINAGWVTEEPFKKKKTKKQKDEKDTSLLKRHEEALESKEFRLGFMGISA